MPAKKKPAKKPAKKVAKKVAKKAVKKQPPKQRLTKIGDQLWATNINNVSYVVIRPRTAIEAIRLIEAMDTKEINHKNRKALVAGYTEAVKQYYRVAQKLGITTIPWGGTPKNAGPVVSVRSLVVAGLRNAQRQLPI